MNLQLVSISEIRGNTINHRTRCRIFAMTKDAGLTSDQLHEHLPEWCGHNSLKDMTEAQAQLVIAALRKIVGKNKMNPSQFGKIKALQSRLKWNGQSLNGFIRHTVKVRGINDLSFTDASKLIIGLEKVAKERKV